MTYGELYKIGNTYECLDWYAQRNGEADKWHKCEIIDVNYNKTGRVKATVKNCSNEVFITKARKPSVILGRSVWERLEYEPKNKRKNNVYNTSTFRNLTINN